MSLSKEKIKKIKETLYTFYDKVDPTGINTDYMKSILEPMSDAQFDKYIRSIIYSRKDKYDLNGKFFKIRTQPQKNDITLNNIRSALKYLGVPLFETVSMPFINEDGEVYTTKHPVATGYLHIKRLQQMVSKKNSMSVKADKRSAITGQVVDRDKNSRVSDMENMALVTLDNDELLKEFLTARSDDLYMKTEMLKQIKNDGYVDLSKIESIPANKVALNTLDVYFTSMGIKTDLITNGLLLKRTLQNQNRDVNTIAKDFRND